MGRRFLIKVILFLFGVSVYSESYCQNSQADYQILKEVKSLPLISNLGTVKGFPYIKELYISKDSLSRGFTVELQDPSYEIIFFLLGYDSDHGDVWEKTIYGNTVTVKNAPILKQLKSGEILHLLSFKIERRSKSFTIPKFIIFVTD